MHRCSHWTEGLSPDQVDKILGIVGHIPGGHCLDRNSPNKEVMECLTYLGRHFHHVPMAMDMGRPEKGMELLSKIANFGFPLGMKDEKGNTLFHMAAVASMGIHNDQDARHLISYICWLAEQGVDSTYQNNLGEFPYNMDGVSNEIHQVLLTLGMGHDAHRTGGMNPPRRGHRYGLGVPACGM